MLNPLTMEPAVQTGPSKRASRWKPVASLGTCYLAMIVLAIAMNLMPVYLPLLGRGIGDGAPLSKEQLGRIAAVTFAGVVLGLLVAGPLANRYPVRWFTASGCFLIALGLGILGFSGNYAQLLVAVGIMGLGAGVLDMILSPVVCAIQPERRAVAMNWLHAFYCVGAVLTVLTASLGLAWRVAWRTTALGMISLPALVGILFLFIPIPPLLTEPLQRRRVRELIFHRFFQLTILTIFLGGATEMGLAQWLPAFTELNLGFSRAVGGASLLAFSVAMVLGRAVVGLVGNRLPIYGIMGWGCASTAVLFVVAGTVPAPAVALTAAVCAGFTGSCLWPSTLGVVADRYPLGGASMFGLLAAAGNFGGVILPWAVGIVADKSTIARGLAWSALCPLAMIATLHLMRREAGPSTRRD